VDDEYAMQRLAAIADDSPALRSRFGGSIRWLGVLVWLAPAGMRQTRLSSRKGLVGDADLSRIVVVRVLIGRSLARLVGNASLRA
jgi:hypothetical protein